MAGDIRVGVIGTGFGAAHVELFGALAGVAVVGIASARAERARELAERTGVPFATGDYRELLERVDAVVIATPPALHAAMALEAIAAGKHMLCEKPLAASEAEARVMRDAADAAGVVHMTNFQMRFTPAYREAARLAGAGWLGRLVMLDARVTINPVDYLHLGVWSTSKAAWFTDQSQAGGLLASSAGPHLVDLARWIGGPVTEVAAGSVVAQPLVTLPDGSTAEVSADDGFLVLLRYAGGAIGTIRGVPVAHRAAGIGWSLELHGDAGSLEVVGDELRGARGGAAEIATLPLPDDVPDNRTRLARLFVEAIRAGTPAPAPTFDDGLAAQAVLDACLAATRSDGWVPVAPA